MHINCACMDLSLGILSYDLIIYCSVDKIVVFNFISWGIVNELHSI